MLRHHHRFYRVEPPGLKDLVALEATTDSNSTRIEPIERSITNRPASERFENMSLATFVEEYEAIDLVSDQKGGHDTWGRMDG